MPISLYFEIHLYKVKSTFGEASRELPIYHQTKFLSVDCAAFREVATNPTALNLNKLVQNVHLLMCSCLETIKTFI